MTLSMSSISGHPPGLAQDDQEEGGAEERRHHAERDLSRRHDRAGDEVGEYEEAGAKQTESGRMRR